MSESPQETVDVVVLHPDSAGNSPVVVVDTETLCTQHQTATLDYIFLFFFVI